MSAATGMSDDSFLHRLLDAYGITVPPATQITKVTFKTNFVGDIPTAIVACVLPDGRRGKVCFNLGLGEMRAVAERDAARADADRLYAALEEEAGSFRRGYEDITLDAVERHEAEVAKR